MNKNIQENGMQRTLQDNGIDLRNGINLPRQVASSTVARSFFLADFVCGNGIGACSFINFGSPTMAST
jgi:hypothetical protein